MSSQPAPSNVFAVPGYRSLWITGWVWHVARWMAVFAGSYRVNEITDDALLVQLVGAAFFAPMFFGGVAVGTLADRLGGRRIVRSVLIALAPLSLAMAWLVETGWLPVASIYVFVCLIGLGNVVDMTARRTIAFGLAGPALLTNAAAMESFGLHFGSMIGSLSGGAIIELVGVAAVYAGIGVVFALALLSFWAALRVADDGAGAAVGSGSRPPSMTADLRASIEFVRSHQMLRRFLVFTVLMNFFYYSFVPLIPVFADRLDVGAFAAGVLASAIGAGTMTGSLVISVLQPRRRGAVHIAGVIGAMTFLVLFAQAGWYPIALLCLFVAGLCGSGFGATQSALVIAMVDEQVRGRALGVLSMAIGALPFGSFTVGLIARQTDPRVAITVSVGLGLALVIGWQSRHPQLRAL